VTGWSGTWGRAGPALLALGAGLLLAGPALGVVAAAVTATVLRAAESRRRRRQRAQEQARAVEACAALAAELRAGRTAGEALAAAAGLAGGPTGEVLSAAAATAALGGDVPAALLPASGDGPAPAVPDLLRGLATCWALCAATGSGLAAAVERLEQAERAALARRRAVAAELAGPRATAGLLAMLPVVGLLLAAALGAQPVQVLLYTPVGAFCLVVGVGLDLLGLAWTERLVVRAGGER